MSEARFVERLREQYKDPVPGVGVSDDCPAPETALRLVLSELKPAEARRFAAHAGSCAFCASAWRFARAYADEAGLVQTAAPRRRWLPAAGLAAAAILTAVLVWLPHEPSRDFEPLMRSPETLAAQSQVEEGAALPADRFVLRWSAGPAGARYDLRVTDASLRHLAGAIGLTAPEYQVSAAALAGLANGDLVLWQVDVVLSDGSRSTSSTFSQRVALP